MIRSKSACSDVVGIDLGTCTVEVCVWKDGTLCHIPLNNGSNIYPSFMYVGKEGILTGPAAFQKSRSRPKQVISNSKRLIGVKYNDPLITRDRRFWACDLVPSPNEFVQFQVHYGDVTSEYTPEDVAATILRDVHEQINSFCDTPIHNAVVSVPATFNNDQRAATMSAARIAGFDKVTLCTEPTAASISYAYNTQQSANVNQLSGYVLVYDLGGGTFDVSILEVAGRNYRICATDGDSHLGGEDFDRLLLAYCVSVLRERGVGPLTAHQQAVLLEKCVEAKECFTREGYKTEISVTLGPGGEERIAVTSQTIAALFTPLVERTIALARRCLAENKLAAERLSRIILVGGSSRLFLVESLLRAEFNTPLSKGVNPDLAVSEGALLIGLGAHARETGDTSMLAVTDCMSYNLFLQTSYVSSELFIPRNTPLPAGREARFAVRDGERLRIALYQGNDAYIGNNTLLGHFYIEGLSELFRRFVVVEFVLNVFVDEGGLIRASATCLNDPSVTKEQRMTMVNNFMDEDLIREKSHQQDRRVSQLKLQREKEAALDMIATVEAATEDPETLKDMDAARSFLDQESIPEDALHELVESLKEQCTVIYAF